jgi:hypothetical protein
MRDHDVNTLSGTNAINVTEEEIPPTVSLVQRVNPDTDQTETGPHTDTNITEGAIPPTVSLSQQVDPDTDQSETGPHDEVNSTELMTQGDYSTKGYYAYRDLSSNRPNTPMSQNRNWAIEPGSTQRFHVYRGATLQQT